uniref:YTH domain-containing protein n=1 Tax=Schistocephalus solidus TaxID=70667 RepID=A0A183T2J6_SCHSO
LGFSQRRTPRATGTTGGLNQVRVSGVVCVFTPGTSAPFPLFLPTPFSPSPPPLSFSSSYSCLYHSSYSSILILPSFPTVEESYGEGDMQSLGFFPVATHRATVTTGGLHQVRVSGVVCAFTSDNPSSKRPDWRTALVAPELARYKVDIAAFSDNRFSEQGQLEEVACYNFFWSTRTKAERRDAGVAFAIRNDIGPQGKRPPTNNGTVKARWGQLRNVIQSTALGVLGRARRQHQDWFDDNDDDISNLLAEKNEQHKAYMDLRTDATKAAFFRCRRLVR